VDDRPSEGSRKPTSAASANGRIVHALQPRAVWAANLPRAPFSSVSGTLVHEGLTVDPLASFQRRQKTSSRCFALCRPLKAIVTTFIRHRGHRELKGIGKIPRQPPKAAAACARAFFRVATAGEPHAAKTLIAGENGDTLSPLLGIRTTIPIRIFWVTVQPDFIAT